MTATAMTAAETIDARRRALALAFRGAGLESPELDARILVGHALGLDHAALAANGARSLTQEQNTRIAELAARRLGHEPIARILERKEFWGLPLHLSPAALVPRPETETVVEAALDAIGTNSGAGNLLIADLGTGSGALLLALLSELRHAFGIGTDLSVQALTTARANAARLGLAGRTAFAACDFAAALSGPFDCIVSNPPYIASGDIETLSPDVREHDPHLALDGGEDGLSCYRAIAAQARCLLKPAGALVVELGAGQADKVTEIMAAQALLADRPARLDLAGIPRALTLRPSP
ncbi:MAG: peptide chain release factor N(5)-glutamine methyltransferase [Pseudorhodoplanes sp.]